MRSHVTLAAGIAALTSTCALAGLPPQATWPYDVSTTGNDVFWVSPTAVDPGSARFQLTYVIQQVLADISLGPIPLGTIDVTGDIPPELQTSTEFVAGPAPIILADETIISPAPPEPPTFGGDFFVRLDSDGHAKLDLTNVILGTATANVPPFGNVTVNLTGVRFIGEVSAQEIPVLADLNLDCVVNTADLGLLIAAFGTTDDVADLNDDGLVDTADLGLILGGFGGACP